MKDRDQNDQGEGQRRSHDRYQRYLNRKSTSGVKDWPKELQIERYRALTGLEPTDAELEMALDLNLL